MRIFLAGIMQGSHVGEVLHNQDYRIRLKMMLAEHLPNAEVYDPLADHEQSLEYDDERARQVFERHNAMCGEVDLLIAFVPEASMGTAVEMYQARQCGRAVVTISPLRHNWAIKFLSDFVYEDIEVFEQALVSGRFLKSLDTRSSTGART